MFYSNGTGKSHSNKIYINQTFLLSPLLIGTSDISINGNGNRNGNDIFTKMESKNGNELEMELE